MGWIVSPRARCSGSNAVIKDEWARFLNAKFVGAIDGTDVPVDGIEGLIGVALKAAAAALGEAGAKAVVKAL